MTQHGASVSASGPAPSESEELLAVGGGSGCVVLPAWGAFERLQARHLPSGRGGLARLAQARGDDCRGGPDEAADDERAQDAAAAALRPAVAHDASR